VSGLVYVIKRPQDVKEILNVFDEEKSPLHALVRLNEYSLTWTISQLYNNARGRPLQLLPFQSVMMDMLWGRKFPLVLMSRGGGKSFGLGVYALTRALLCPGSKIVIVGAGLRQSMHVFNYIIGLYNQSPIIQESLKRYGGPKITTSGPYINVGNLSKITALPIGDGEKIRGQRATHIICDEFASIPEGVFETVIRPFASVHADPEERVRVEEFCNRLCDCGADDALIEKIRDMQGYGNQVILSGTASYEFNHFYKYYRSYEAIINSRGDSYKIQKAMEERARTSMQNQFSNMKQDEIKTLAAGWKNYAIYQLPYHGIPRGFLDAENIANDKATFSPVRFGMEYECRFAKDSDGFIKRSLINDATPADEKSFTVELYGDPSYEYVMGLDPARHNDNFGLIVLKLVPGGSELVYADAWRGKDTPFSVKKIRDVMRRFNIVRIAMDQGGGGDAVADTLRLKELCEKDELPIFPVKEQIGDKRLLGEQGLFILDIVKWSSNWISIAAHGLHGDIEHLRLLFPTLPIVSSNPNKKANSKIAYQYMPQIVEQYASRALRHERQPDEEECQVLDNMIFGKENDDFEKVEDGTWDHIQSTIDETCAIERMVTPGGVEQFELPKLQEQREGLDVRRRDRFSALVLAAYAARVYRAEERNRKPIKSGGSPNSILNRKGRGRRKIVRKGAVMY